MTKLTRRQTSPAQRMNHLAATFLAGLVAFVAWFSWNAWQTEKSFIAKEQENVLEFASRHVNGYFLRVESGFLRLSLELTEGRGQQIGKARLLLNGLKTRNRDFMRMTLALADGTTLMTASRQSDEDRPLPHPDSNTDTEEKSGLYRNFWNAEIHEKYQLTIEQEAESFPGETHTLITRYHHSDESGRFRHTLSGILRMSILRDYWLSAETLKRSSLWIAGDNGSLIQLYPARTRSQEENEYNRVIAESMQNRLRQSSFPEKGKFEAQWNSGKESQVAVFQRLANYPFTVILSVPKSVILSNWWRQVRIPFGLSFLLLAVGVFSYQNTARNQRSKEREAARMQEQLRISNERWKLALECAGGGMWEAVRQPAGIRFSWHSSELAGLPNSEGSIPLEGWINLIHPDDQPYVRECLERYFSGKLSEFQIEHRVLGKQGQWRWLLVRGDAIKRGADQSPIHVLGTLTDITLQKLYLQQLEEREGSLRQGFILLPTGVSVLAGDGLIIEANPALCRMFGYAENELIGMSLEQFFEKESLGATLLGFELSAVEEDIYTTRERTAIHKSGYRFPVVYKLSPVPENRKNGGQKNFIAQIEDLSERKHAQLQDTAKEVLRAQEEDRAQLSRELHDEVGQSLTALKFTIKLAQQKLPDIDETQRCLNEGQKALDDLIGNIRTLANWLRPVAIDQLGLISALRSHIAKSVRPLGLHVTLLENIGEDRLSEPLELCCFRVIQEALTNCLRHAQASNVEISLTRVKPRLYLSVKDDGIGLDISRYYSLRENSGSLGIIGMHERVAANGGELQIRSAPGKGTEIIAAFSLSGEI